MSNPGVDPQLVDVLNRASSLQLFQLSTLIERMLADPRRIIAVRVNMPLGQTVRFLDWRDGSLREGKVLAMKDTQVTLQDLTERREWKLIEHTHVDQLQRGLQRLRQKLVGAARLRCARRMLGCIRKCQHRCRFHLVAWTLSRARAALASFRGE